MIYIINYKGLYQNKINFNLVLFPSVTVKWAIVIQYCKKSVVRKGQRNQANFRTKIQQKVRVRISSTGVC